MNAMIDKHVLKDRNNSWIKFIKRLPPGSKKFWNLTKAMKREIVKTESLNVDGAEVYNSNEKANIIANVFENSHQTTINMTSKVETKVMDHMQWLSSQNIPNSINLSTIEEIKQFTRKLKNYKAPGIDGIKPILLKNMPETFFSSITNGGV